MLLLGGRLQPVEEQELGAVEADALRPGGQQLGNLLQELHVPQQPDPEAIRSALVKLQPYGAVG